MSLVAIFETVEYVTPCILHFETCRFTFSVETGEVIGGQLLPFYALDSIVTNDGQIITVGFEWTPSFSETDGDSENPQNASISARSQPATTSLFEEQLESVPFSQYGDPPMSSLSAFHKKFPFSPSDILPFLQRKAVFQVLNNEVVENTSCIGCEADHFGSKCQTRCFCENGYCDDDLSGSGDCYCTLMSYGQYCRLCDGLSGSCSPEKGICNSGPHGDGKCKICYDAKLNISDSVHFDFHLG